LFLLDNTLGPLVFPEWRGGKSTLLYYLAHYNILLL